MRSMMKATFGLALLVGALVPRPAGAQGTTFFACYVPSVGAVYMIKLSGLPTACLSASHVEISWTEGGAPADGSITTVKLADGAVTTPKLGDAAVTTPKIAPGTSVDLLGGQPSSSFSLTTHNHDATYAALSHNHDMQYFTQTALQSPGMLNDAANPMDWTKLKSVPAGFADGVDDGGVSYTGSGAIALVGTDFQLATTGCVAGDLWKWTGMVWSCDPDANSGGTITGVTAGTGLFGGGTVGSVTLGIATGGVTSAHVADGSLTGVDHAAASIGTTQLADASVASAKIAAGAVGNFQLGANAVTTGNIVDGAVTALDIGPGAVGTTQLANASVTSAKLAAPASVSGVTLPDAPNIGTTATSIGSVTISIPASGKVLVMLSGYAVFFGDNTTLHVGLGSTPAAFDLHELSIGRLDGSGTFRYEHAFAPIAVVNVTAGTRTFYATALKPSVFSANTINVAGLRLVALYLPN